MELNADEQAGLKALQYFHNASLQYADYPARNTDELLEAYGNKAMIYAEGIGLAINANGMSPEAVQTAMENLAKEAKGRLPKDHNAFMHALQGEASRVSYLDLTATVAGEVVGQVAAGAQAVGNSVITSFSWLLTALPFIVVGGAVLWALNNSGGTEKIVKAVRARRKAAAK